MLRELFGFGLIIIGMIFSVFNRYFCRFICNVCDNQQLSPCFFLFLFVGIILIIDGASLVLLGEKSKK